MKKYRYIVLKLYLIIFFLLTTSISGNSSIVPGFDSNSRYDILHLDIDGIIPLDRFGESRLKNISIAINYKNIHPYKMGLNGFYLNIEGFTPRSIPGEPIIPMKTYIVDLPLNSHITNIGFTSGHYIYLKKPLKPAIASKPLFWSSYDEIGFAFEVKYNPTEWYPGKLLSYNIGYDNEKTRVYIRLYPIQYISNQVLVLIDGVISIGYKIEDEGPRYSIKSSSFSNLIITPPSFYQAAEQLKEFHENQSIITEIVNTTWIYENYNESDDPPFPGYADDDYIKSILNKYNYSLAKRIISYLKDISAHPNLEYITLFGTAEYVPPSYYYQGIYSTVPTDLFYASPDYDFLLNYKIGRIPVNSLSTAHHVVDKIIHWNLSPDLFRNITVAGGKPFNTPYDIGEMIVIDSINQGFFNGIKPNKLFRTENMFNKSNIIKSLKGGTGVIYHIGHGSGDAWYLEGDPIYTDEILKLPHNNNLPIVVSIACLNGAFDTKIDKTLNLKTSFGESILFSKAGGVAYIGGSRENAGIPIFSLDRGHLEILGERYMAAMLTNFFEAYSDNNLSVLGDLTDRAMQRYIENHDFDDSLDLYTLFCFTLLGDPVLKIPSRPIGEETSNSTIYLYNSEGYINTEAIQLPYLFSSSNEEIPVYPILDPLSYNISSNVEELDIKIVDSFAFEKPTLFKTHINSMQTKPSIYVNDSSIYSIRIINPDGKENWLFLAISLLVDDDYNNDTQGFHINRWNNIQEAVDLASEDDIIYLKPGIYHEHVTINTSIMLFGSDPSKTIIDGDGKDIALRIIDDNCVVSYLTIMNSVIGVSIEGDENILIGNIIRDNRLEGISTREKMNFSGFLIIAFNKIYNNTDGLYILQPSLYIALNEISSNNIGIYIKDSTWNTIWENNISKNHLGIYIEGKLDENIVVQNNFIDNDRHAMFSQSKNNIWVENYWGRPYILPKIIVGRIGKLGIIPWINIDPMPAAKPWLFSL